MKDAWCGIGSRIVTLLFIALLGLLVAFPLQFAWNETIPVIFGLPEVTYWQAYLLLWLKALLLASTTVQHHNHK